VTLKLLSFLFLALMLFGVQPADARTYGSSQVGLVVQSGDGSTSTRCITFNEPEISRYDVLNRSGLDLVVSGGALGLTICDIEGESGCPAAECFCQCPPPGDPCEFWHYWHLTENEWVTSPLGASSSVVHHGDVEGWSWGAGDAPALIAFEEICAPAYTVYLPMVLRF